VKKTSQIFKDCFWKSFILFYFIDDYFGFAFFFFQALAVTHKKKPPKKAKQT
jgi:hypothetical protein